MSGVMKERREGSEEGRAAEQRERDKTSRQGSMLNMNRAIRVCFQVQPMLLPILHTEYTDPERPPSPACASEAMSLSSSRFVPFCKKSFSVVRWV